MALGCHVQSLPTGILLLNVLYYFMPLNSGVSAFAVLLQVRKPTGVLGFPIFLMAVALALSPRQS